MKLKVANLLITAALAFTSACATAQTRFCLGGDLTHLSASQRTSCNAKMQAAKVVLAALHAPEDWHFVMVCGAEGWDSYVSFVGGENASLVDANADTVLDQGETFLRADRLDLNQPLALKKIVAHEVATIVLQSRDELAISKKVESWAHQPAYASGL